MILYPLKPLEFLILLVIVAIVDVFTSIQKNLLPQNLQPVTYLVVVIVLLFAFFGMVRPADPRALAGTLALILGIIVILLIFLQDVVIGFSTITWNTLIILLGALACPFIAGFLYGMASAPVPEN